MDSFFVGSPPRMRGKGDAVRDNLDAGGITPAHAGKRSFAGMFMWCGRDHPRTCGEKLEYRPIVIAQAGLPPRMRGKDLVGHADLFALGITPAHAGKRHLYDGKKT